MPHPVRLSEDPHSLSLSFGDRKLTVHHGDVNALQADALVCPVDQNLDFCSGVARVISQAAGKDIHHHRPMFPEPFGKVVVLPGGNLHVKYLFLTVLLGEKDFDKTRIFIREGVDRAIRYAEFLRLQTLAFPVLGCPKAQPPYPLIAREMLEDISKYFQRKNTKMKMILFSAFNPDAFEAFRQEAKTLSFQ